MTEALTIAEAASSPFSGVDVFELAGWTVVEGFPRPLFDQDVWDLRGILGRPKQLSGGQLIWDFTKINNSRWRLVAKELMIAYCAPAHPAVAQLPHAYRTPRALATTGRVRGLLFPWLNWLTSQGIASLREVTQEHCQRYLAVRSTIRDKHGRRLRAASPSQQRAVVTAVMDLAFYSDLFTNDRYHPSFRPWNFTPPAVVAGMPKQAENKTQPVPDHILQPLLAACLYIVDTLGPHLTVLLRQVESRPPRHGGARRPNPTFADLARALDEHRSTGDPLVEMTDRRVNERLAAGWNPDDPLLRVNFLALAVRVGCREVRSHMLTPGFRELAEDTVAKVGLAKPWGREVAAVPRADTQELVPWITPLHTQKAQDLAGVARQAALTVIAAVSGMRNSELAELLVGCRRTREVGPGMVRHSLASKIIKGQKLGGLEDEWVVLEEVHRAVELAEQVHLHAGPGESLFGRIGFHSGYTRALRPFVNGPLGRRLGLAPIPDGTVNLRMLRRTLAMELAYRPNGMLAAKIALKHLSVVTTEGYTARPGGAQAKLLAEVNEHEQERNLSLAAAEFRNFQQGILPSGTGAHELIDFFTHVDEELARQEATSPHVRSSDQDLRNLLAKRAGTLHLGTANYCWFADPGKALCLKLAGTPNATKPLAGMCDSARCPQATHHPCHRPIWAETVTQTKTFLGSLSRPQKTERIRLRAELDRAQRVLDEIDAAGSGPEQEIHADH
ncbi:integrase [Streptomyces kronopolitis]|uniref:Integrase n=1 Tax=Streptomyces kronopolitis TaxID=1612435 RepID=A0ABQ2J342_9ACTN|nr:site-specific integrase [Streptomyces kronopolitis]GGN36056.1 integrase [Streptomyces kronopolitis]